jgi:hypothetical protein
MAWKKLLISGLGLLTLAAFVFAADYQVQKLHPVKVTGSGDIVNGWTNEVKIVVDTTHDSSGAKFWTDMVNADCATLSVGGFFAWKAGYFMDSTYGGDSLAVSLKTGYTMEDGYNWTIQCDTVTEEDTIWYMFDHSAYADSLWKSAIWFEFNYWDSTSDTGNARLYPDRSLFFDAAIDVKGCK